MGKKVAVLLGILFLVSAISVTASALTPIEQLGKSIFLDLNLSINQNQSCASCHGKEVGWTGPLSDINAQGSVYEGSIPGEFGNRKPPSAAYATVSPILHMDKKGLIVGGNFWDGRAIDVSKDSFSAAGIDSKGNVLFEGSYSMDAEGFGLFLEIVIRHGKDLKQILAAMESTGCYHLNLFSFLNQQGLQVVVINPLLISNFAKLSLRKTKTDKKDARTIAQFIVQHQDAVSGLAVSQGLQDLRDLARERESLCHFISETKSEIKRVLRTTFPELESLCDISTKVMLQFLLQYSSARMITSAKQKDIVKALERKGVGTRLTFSAQDIIVAAKNSVGIPTTAKVSAVRI